LSADTTVGATHGMRSTPVQKERKRIFDVSTSAITMPSTSLKATEPKVKMKLLMTARWKKPSWVSLM
jgi:hypothetical protein